MKMKLLFCAALMGVALVGNGQTNTFPASGNVGIGVISPVSTFHLRHSSALYNPGGMVLENSSSTSVYNIINSNNNLFIGFNSNSQYYPQGDYLTRLFINNDGFVGIGTTSPSAYLHVGKQEAPANTAGQSTRLALQPYGHTGGPWNFICRDIPGVAFLDIYYGAGQALTINSSCNVGIGTTSPQNKLDVNGTIHAKEVKVDLTGWSDFVFAPTYKLKPLNEIEQYIKTHNHLPEIPSANEVAQNGVSLGDMQAKLLQKVEELTLYSIEQEKKLKEQDKVKAKVEEQEKQLQRQEQTNTALEGKVAEQDKKLDAQAKEIEELKQLIKEKLK